MAANDTDRPLHQCSAARIAPAAVQWLSTALPARSLQIFEKVCNLVNAQGDVLSLILPVAEMSPLALELRCDEPASDLRKFIFPQSKVRLEGDILRVGELAVDLAPQTLWDPVPDWKAVREKDQSLPGLMNEVVELLRADHAPESLATFLVPKALESPPEGWQGRAFAPISRLLEGLAGKDVAVSAGGAHDLAGLGMGLTPSGDDFIIGVMHALWCAWPAGEAEELCVALLGAVVERTNRLSASYLTRAAQGEAAEVWHRLIDALGQGDAAGLRAPVEALIKLGHTSGQDALSGFLLGYRTTIS